MRPKRRETRQTTPEIPFAAEPTTSTGAAPVWLMVMLYLLLFWGMVYFDQHSGWFDSRIYAPYRSLEEVVMMQPPKDDDSDLLFKGQRLFQANCAVCHMDNGAGNPVNGCPPLAGSEWVAAPGAGRLVRIISKGLTGPIEVRGKLYDTGTMGAIGDQMPGDEMEKAENIAAIISYIRKVFGGGARLVRPNEVAAIREQIVRHQENFTAHELKSIPEHQ
jgi:mono/diheme cytochrome c family protein